MVECLFRLTTERDRTAMAKQWYMSSPLVLRTFNAIRESNFEVVWSNSVALVDTVDQAVYFLSNTGFQKVSQHSKQQCRGRKECI